MVDFEQEIGNLIGLMLESWRKKIEEFDQWLKVEQLAKPKTRLNYLNALRNLSTTTSKELFQLKKQDIVNWKTKLMESSEGTQTQYTISIRKFFQWFYGYEQREYPEIVKWLKVKKVKKIPKFELTLEDVKKLADTCKSQRDRCLIMLAYDTGCRPAELLNIKIKDLRKDDRGYRIWLQGGSGLKTGERTLRIYPSIPDLELWLSMHPDKNNSNAYLFPNPEGKPLSHQRFNQTLQYSKKKAGIEKRLTPHSFRHLRATELCNSLSDAQMKARFGWTMDSRQLATYIHQSGVDVDECFLRHHGIEIKQEKPKTLEPQVCIRGHKNSPSALYCSTCGLPLDQKEAIQIDKQIKARESERYEQIPKEEIATIEKRLSHAEKLLETLLTDPDISELVKKKLTREI
jgi:site-specific recombinase XerD